MINKKYHVLKEVTLVIQSHYHHKFLQRILNYYQNVGLPILVADSNNTAFIGHKQYPNVKYFHYPNSPFPLKMSKVFQHVKTPYVVTCGDDDFIVPSSIIKCLSFLENNSDYVSVQGQYVSFSNEKEVNAYPLYTNLIEGNDINGEIARERLKQSMHPYIHQFYSVQHIEDTKYFFQNINSEITNQSLGEIAMVLTGTINGKHKVLPIFYCARDSIQDPKKASKCQPSVLEIMVEPELRKDYEAFLLLIGKYFSQKTGCDSIEAQKYICKIMEYHKTECLKKYNLLNSFKRNMLQMKNKYLKPFVPEWLIQHRRSNHSKKFVGHPFYEAEGIKEWNNVKCCILSHN